MSAEAMRNAKSRPISTIRNHHCNAHARIHIAPSTNTVSTANPVQLHKLPTACRFREAAPVLLEPVVLLRPKGRPW